MSVKQSIVYLTTRLLQIVIEVAFVAKFGLKKKQKQLAFVTKFGFKNQTNKQNKKPNNNNNKKTKQKTKKQQLTRINKQTNKNSTLRMDQFDWF